MIRAGRALFVILTLTGAITLTAGAPPAAGHYVFLAPCPEALASQASLICVDPPRVDRGALHERLNGEILDFFRRTLTAG